VLLGAAVVGGSLVAVLSARPAARTIPVSARAALFALILFPVALAVRLAPAIPAGVVTLMVVGTAGMVILWELVGGLLLMVPRFQGPLLAFSWTMHAMLSLIGFVHFGALAIAMLFTFVPTPYVDLVTTRVRLPFVGRSVPRSHVYFASGLLTGVVSGFGSRIVAAVMFNLAVLFLLWPMLRAVVAQAPRPVWPGVSLWSRRTPAWLYAFPVFLLLYGLTSYVGLRTAGNFTMFSNLRTEGARSNHLVLGSNQVPARAGQSAAGRGVQEVDLRVDERGQGDPADVRVSGSGPLDGEHHGRCGVADTPAGLADAAAGFPGRSTPGGQHLPLVRRAQRPWGLLGSTCSVESRQASIEARWQASTNFLLGCDPRWSRACSISWRTSHSSPSALAGR
jgi:hypothetical protein